jgi:hypothetical protein
MQFAQNICLKGYSGTILMGNHGGFQTFMRAPANFAFKVKSVVLRA